MSTQSELRKAIKAQFPNLKFTIKTVSFSDLARGERTFVESMEWGMTKGNHETFEAVKAIAQPFNAIVSW